MKIGSIASLCYAGILHDKSANKNRVLLVGGLNWDMNYLLTSNYRGRTR